MKRKQSDGRMGSKKQTGRKKGQKRTGKKRSLGMSKVNYILLFVNVTD